jgi:membrane-bound lytic murein transglycosylase D
MRLVISSILFFSLAFSSPLLAQLATIPEDSNDVIFTPPTLYDYIPHVEEAIIKARMETMNSKIPMDYNARVKVFIDYFTVRERDYTRNMARKQNIYFPLFEKYLAKHGLPDELKYLAIVESGLNPRAKSRAGAVGLWQFMPATGRMFKLNQTTYADDRMDPERATEAACLYLKQLYGIFGDWHLALASYNAGPGNVRKAITRSGGKRNFWQLWDFLPRETRSYVPQFIAVSYAMRHLEDHNLMPLDIEFAPNATVIAVNNYISLEKFSEASGVCMDDLELLNPSLLRGYIPVSASNYPLKVPAHQAGFILADLRNIMEKSSLSPDERSKIVTTTVVASEGSTSGREKLEYRVKSGDVLGKIATQHKVSVNDLKGWNNLNSNMIRVGQKLDIWIPTSGSTSTASSPKPAATVASTPNPVTTTSSSTVTSTTNRFYQVKPGDTLWDIARKHQMSVEELKKRNNLTGNNIRVGQRLNIG